MVGISAGTAALIGAGVSAAGAGAGILSSMSAADKNAAAQSAALGQAKAGSAQQLALQEEILRQQREFQTAGQYDAEGNSVTYVKGVGWVVNLGERGRERLASQQEAQDLESRKYFGRQQTEETQAALRRGQEGGASRELLDQIRNQYGAPTREGVTGAAKIAGVTPAGEANEALKSGAATSSLRTGGNVGTLGAQFNALDRSSATGQRSALAAVDAQPDMYNQILDQWRGGKLAAYTPLAQRASNIGNTPAPTSGQEALTAQIAARASKPYSVSPYMGATLNASNKDLINAFAADKNTFPTGTFGGIADTINRGFKDVLAGYRADKSTNPADKYSYPTEYAF